MRDPRDVIKGRIDARVNRKIYDAKVKARQSAEGAAKKAISGAGKKKQTQGGAPEAAKKKKMGWWPFGGKEEGGEAAAGCPGCGAEIDPSWKQCPYCGNDLAADAPAPAGQAPPPQGAGPAPGGGGAPAMPQIASNRTMAVDIEALKAPKKEVVGWLVIMNGAQKGTDYRLYPGKNSLGAGADNDVVITDEYLSTRHAYIRYEDNKYELVDADSTNGCFVNDKKVTKEELIDNDSIRLGRTEFRFKALY